MGAPLALLLVGGGAFLRWRREGDDPELVDSPSILAAGPPAGMTPALATVVRDGRATRHSLNVTLLEIASTGRIGFANLENVSSARSDADADPDTDPAIHVLPPGAATPRAEPGLRPGLRHHPRPRPRRGADQPLAAVGPQ